MKIKRYAYLNTQSMAGKPKHIELDSTDVTSAYCWVNFYGNPSYTLYLENGDFLYCVDDYGCMNDINHINAKTVARKKDLF